LVVVLVIIYLFAASSFTAATLARFTGLAVERGARFPSQFSDWSMHSRSA
jgi:hypothetical protein